MATVTSSPAPTLTGAAATGPRCTTTVAAPWLPSPVAPSRSARPHPRLRPPLSDRGTDYYLRCPENRSPSPGRRGGQGVRSLRYGHFGNVAQKRNRPPVKVLPWSAVSDMTFLSSAVFRSATERYPAE